MSETGYSTSKPPLDIRRILTRSLDLFRQNFLVFFFVAAGLAAGIILFEEGLYLAAGLDPELAFGTTRGLAIQMAGLLLSSLVQAVICYLALSLLHAGRAQFGQAISVVAGALLPIVLVNALVLLAIGIGLVLLVVPGVVIAAVFFVVMPALVYERAGFGALQRSYALVKGYRAAVIGLIVITIGVSLIVAMIASALDDYVYSLLFQQDLGQNQVALTASWVATSAALQGLLVPLNMIVVAVTYKRLRDIKEGGETEELIKVFE